MRRRFLFLLALIAMATAIRPWPLGVAFAQADAAQGKTLAAGALVEVDLDAGEAVYDFVAPSGSVYDVWLFPAEAEAPAVKARLWRGDRLVAEGEGGMPALSLRLAAGTEYRLALSGSGRGRLELARHALSRCYALPMLLKAGGDAYSKAFVREGDVHWYALDADSEQPVSLLAVPGRQDMRLDALLIDDGGRLLKAGSHTAGGASLLDFVPEAGKRYRVRLSCQEGGTGLYDLRLDRLTGDALPEQVILSRRSVVIEGRSTVALTADVSPEGTADVLYWESAQSTVARVDSRGRVTGRAAGQTVITAYAPGGVSDFCVIEVKPVAVTGVALLSGKMTLSVGDDAAIECDVMPENATNTRLVYEAQPEGIVGVDARGVLRGIAEGDATVTVRSQDGGFSDTLSVHVNPAPRRWRALLVGEQNYAEGVAAVRVGSIHSVSGMRSMLENLSFDGARFQVNTLLDASRDEVLAGIENGFSEAGDRDLSLFYITCHGYYAGGMTCLQMYDGSILAAAELAQALRNVRGDVLVVIDCCGSGGVIGRASSTADILKGIGGVFDGNLGPSVMGTSRFRVLASAALEQESYRVSFNSSAGESDMSTVFARALCEAGGWSIDRGAGTALRADRNYDGRVTLTELYSYVARRVMWYLNLTATLNGVTDQYVQTVQLWPEGDGLVVMQR